MVDNKNKAMGVGIFILVIIAALVGLDYLGIKVLPQAAVEDGDGVAVAPGGAVIQVETCPEDISIKHNDIDTEDRRNDPGANLRVYDPDRGNISDDGSDTFGTNVDIKAIAGFASTSYYGDIFDFRTDCKDPQDIAPELARSGSLTITIVNDDSITKNTESDDQVIDANDEREVVILYDVSSNRYWGAPDAAGSSIITCEFNKTIIDSVKIENAVPTSAPSIWSLANTNYNSEDSFIIENLVDGEKKSITAIINSANVDPIDNNLGINCTFFDANIDLNLETFEVIKGVEDESKNDITLNKVSRQIFMS